MIIHHINGDKKDNRIENLQMVTFCEHMNIHKQMKKEKRLKQSYAVEPNTIPNPHQSVISNGVLPNVFCCGSGADSSQAINNGGRRV
jgi:hypothetical protein